MSRRVWVGAVWLVTAWVILDARGGDRADDEAAIRAVSAAWTESFNKADLPALGLLIASDARVIDPEERLEGREAILARLAARFEAEPGATMEVRIDGIRFLSDEVAIEEGHATVRSAAGVEANGYVATYVRRDGGWLIAEIRDLPEQPLDVAPRGRLEELAWMIGEWVDESDEATVEFSCRWSESGPYLLREYTVKVGGQVAMRGSQRIGWDAGRKQIRSWAFDDAGGFAEGFWSRDADGRWVVKVTGTTAEGMAVSATQVYTPIDSHVIRFESYDLTRGDRIVDDALDVRLVHRPPAPDVRADSTPSRRQEP